MLAYILRRLLIALVSIFVLATITFFLMRLVPGDPFASPRITTEVRARLHAHYGLDKPLIEQYLIYMANLAQGDFGYSLTQRGRQYPMSSLNMSSGFRAFSLMLYPFAPIHPSGKSGCWYGYDVAVSAAPPQGICVAAAMVIG